MGFYRHNTLVERDVGAIGDCDDMIAIRNTLDGNGPSLVEGETLHDLALLKLGQAVRSRGNLIFSVAAESTKTIAFRLDEGAVVPFSLLLLHATQSSVEAIFFVSSTKDIGGFGGCF